MGLGVVVVTVVVTVVVVVTHKLAPRRAAARGRQVQVVEWPLAANLFLSLSRSRAEAHFHPLHRLPTSNEMYIPARRGAEPQSSSLCVNTRIAQNRTGREEEEGKR